MIIHLSCDEPPTQPAEHAYVGDEEYPRHITTLNQRNEWTDLIIKGIELRDPFAPRLSPLEMRESSARGGITVAEFTWAMYAPCDSMGRRPIPFSPHLTVEQAHFLFKDEATLARERRRQTAWESWEPTRAEPTPSPV